MLLTMSVPNEKSTETVEATETPAVVHSKSKENYEGVQPSAGEVRQKWYQWFASTDTPAERRLILKLDGLIIVFVFLAYWAKVLDSSASRSS